MSRNVLPRVIALVLLVLVVAGIFFAHFLSKALIGVAFVAGLIVAAVAFQATKLGAQAAWRAAVLDRAAKNRAASSELETWEQAHAKFAKAAGEVLAADAELMHVFKSSGGVWWELEHQSKVADARRQVLGKSQNARTTEKTAAIARAKWERIALKLERSRLTEETECARIKSQSSPPRLAEYLMYLFWGTRKERRDALLGDLEEEFRDCIFPRFGPRRARFWYWWQVIGSLCGPITSANFSRKMRRLFVICGAAGLLKVLGKCHGTFGEVLRKLF